jgi:Zn-dependent protease with chaperone function
MHPYRRLYFLAFLIFTFLCAYAQEFSFIPFKNDSSYSYNVQSGIKKIYDEDVSLLTGSNKKHITDIYKERYQLIKERFTNNEILTAGEPLQYLSALANEILKSNPQYNSKSLNILFSKSFYANAASMGEGTIFFNIGLFHRLQNESQAAFVLCHELAHYYLNHSNNNIHQYVATVNSDEFSKNLRAFKNYLIKEINNLMPWQKI